MCEDSSVENKILMIGSTELDFLTAIEGEVSLPIAFRDKEALQYWVGQNRLSVLPIGRRRKAVVVSGLVERWGYSEGLTYNQIWVDVGYRAYRDAVKSLLRMSEGSTKDIHRYDGDHAVSRTRLSRVWPQAWVNLVLVERGLNRSIGAMMEKDTLHVDQNTKRLGMNAECILKAFLVREGPLKRSDIASYLRECRDRFVLLASSGQLISDGSVSAEIEKFAMSERADEFFAKMADDCGVDLKSVLPEKQMIVLH